MKNNPEFDIAYQTDAGLKRGGENQDSVLVIKADAARGFPPLLVVADGMGGHVGGAVASQKVVEAMATRFQQAETSDDSLTLIGECLQSAEEALRLHAEQNPELSSMGSTVVAAILFEDHATIANVGDSRAYLISEHEMTQVSFDHSVVGDQLRLKIITPVEARSHPMRNRLTQSLSPKRTSLKPHICQVPFGESDTLVLCSDGLWGVIPEASLKDVAINPSTRQAVGRLVQLALDNGGPDNITVILARHAQARPTKLLDGNDQPGG